MLMSRGGISSQCFIADLLLSVYSVGFLKISQYLIKFEQKGVGSLLLPLCSLLMS